MKKNSASCWLFTYKDRTEMHGQQNIENKELNIYQTFRINLKYNVNIWKTKYEGVWGSEQ